MIRIPHYKLSVNIIRGKGNVASGAGEQAGKSSPSPRRTVASLKAVPKAVNWRMKILPRARECCRFLGLLALSAGLQSCGGNNDGESVLTIGPEGNVVEADKVDELAPFDPAVQQLIFHLNLAQTEQFVKRFPGATIIDSRPADQYEAGHLSGATNVDWLADKELFQMFVGQLPKEEKYLVYGSVAMVEDTAAAIALMRGIGFQNIYTFYESYDAWQNGGLPFEQGPDPEPLPLPERPENVAGETVEAFEANLEIWKRAEQQVKLRNAAKPNK